MKYLMKGSREKRAEGEKHYTPHPTYHVPSNYQLPTTNYQLPITNY
nr:hypothetical protein [Chroococcidiopsis cubana]